MLSNKVGIHNGRFVNKAKVTDTIYKGFMLYKAGTNEFEAKSNIDGTIYNGSLDDVKRQIDKYWEKKDAEEVLKSQSKDSDYISFFEFMRLVSDGRIEVQSWISRSGSHGVVEVRSSMTGKVSTLHVENIPEYIKIKDSKDADDGYSTITVVVRDQDSALFNCIQKIKGLSDPGHSFEGVLDPNGDNPEKIGFDGDGSFFIKSISREQGDKIEYSGVGKHNDTPDEDFDQDQLAKGISVEMEHTDNEDIAKAIAKDHLSEMPDYYTRLKQMEGK